MREVKLTRIDREIRLRLGNAPTIIRSVGGDLTALSASQKAEYERKMKIFRIRIPDRI